jgi:hypothetical protein
MPLSETATAAGGFFPKGGRHDAGRHSSANAVTRTRTYGRKQK